MRERGPIGCSLPRSPCRFPARRAVVMLWLVAALAVAPRGSKAGQTNALDVLDFVNKDRLHGVLLSADPSAYGLKWKHESAALPADFEAGAIASVTLSRKQPAHAGSGVMVELSNDDQLPGDLVSLDGEKLVLDTWYGGRIVIKRAMVRAVTPAGEKGGIVYEGPDDLQQWVMGRVGIESWKLKNGTLYAIQQYAIGRYIEGMPDKVAISFDAAWRGQPSFNFAFFASKLEQQSYQGCYFLQLSGQTLYLHRSSINGGQRQLCFVQMSEIGEMRSGGSGSFCVMVDKKESRFAIMLNGKLIRECSDGEEFAGTGNGIQFQSHSAGNLRIRNIKISQWDGKIPQPGGATASAKDDFVKLRNGDKVSGSVKSAADGKVHVETTFAAMDIPLDRIAELRMADEVMERARRMKNDVRAYFADNGRITMELTKLADGSIEGNSENFGAMKAPADAFRLLEFNIYREKEEEESDDFLF